MGWTSLLRLSRDEAGLLEVMARRSRSIQLRIPHYHRIVLLYHPVVP
jgi:hypothetical protein